MLMNTSDTYGSVAKFFHWVIAITIICLLVVGFFMDDISTQDLKFTVYNLHKLFGLLVLTLAALRLVWRLINPTPLLPPMHRWEIIVEKTVVVLLYIAMILMPLSGWIMSTAAGHIPHLGNFNLAAPFVPADKDLAHFFAKIHNYTAWTIIGLVTLHLIGGLKHHIVNRDNVLRRMMPGAK